MGEGIRLHQDADPDFAQLMGIGCYQISFNDKPDAKSSFIQCPQITRAFS